MFSVIRRKKRIGFIDEIKELTTMCINQRSLRPIMNAFRRGRYGSRMNLDGTYLGYMRYEDRKRRHTMFNVVD